MGNVLRAGRHPRGESSSTASGNACPAEGGGALLEEQGQLAQELAANGCAGPPLLKSSESESLPGWSRQRRTSGRPLQCRRLLLI